MDDLTDEELLAKYRERGERSIQSARWLDALFARYHKRVAAWCYRFTGERESAGDLAQDVMLRAYRNLDSFRGASKFSTWMFTIARNHCVNEMKARGSRADQNAQTLDFEVEDSGQPGILARMEQEQSRTMMQSLINENLEPIEKKVLSMHFGSEIRLETVTRLLGLTNTSGAKAYVVSARRKLSQAATRRLKRAE